MSIYVKIKRQNGKGEEPYFETFEHEGQDEKTVANILQDLNSRDELYTVEGKRTTKIIWECSCLEKKCGACAMIICKRPALACSVFLKDLKLRDNTITIEPLRKFPVLKDLQSDRSIMAENLKMLKVWLKKEAKFDDSQFERLYNSSKCLMCGCCLDICPKYKNDDNFIGAAMLNAAFKIIKQSEFDSHREEIIEKLNNKFFYECKRDFACSHMCPAGIPLKDIILSGKEYYK